MPASRRRPNCSSRGLLLQNPMAMAMLLAKANPPTQGSRPLPRRYGPDTDPLTSSVPRGVAPVKVNIISLPLRRHRLHLRPMRTTGTITAMSITVVLLSLRPAKNELRPKVVEKARNEIRRSRPSRSAPHPPVPSLLRRRRRDPMTPEPLQASSRPAVPSARPPRLLTRTQPLPTPTMFTGPPLLV